MQKKILYLPFWTENENEKQKEEEKERNTDFLSLFETVYNNKYYKYYSKGILFSKDSVGKGCLVTVSRFDTFCWINGNNSCGIFFHSDLWSNLVKLGSVFEKCLFVQTAYDRKWTVADARRKKKVDEN